MRYLILLCLLVVGIAAGCSTTNTGVEPTPEREVQQTFSVTTEDGLGSFTPVLNVEENASGATVTVTAENASDLAAAYVNVHYDSARFSPATVEVGDFLGSEGEVISLAVTEMRDVVPVGIAQVAKSGARPVNGEGVIAVLHFDASPFISNRGVSGSPKGSANAVTDLQITNHVGDDYTLQWTEKNAGDYDNNSLVGIADLTPLGQLLGTSVNSASDIDWARLVDGNGDGEINIADITPIGANFGNKMDGYVLYADGTAQGGGVSVPRSAQTIDPKKAVRYVHLVNMAGTPEFIVRPVASDEIQVPGPPSNPAVINIDTEAPDAPVITGVNGGESVGNRTLEVFFTKSSASDVATYTIQRKLSSEDDSAWADVVTQAPAGFEGGPTQFNYIDFNPAFTDVSYDYRMRAADEVNNQSGFSNVMSGTPFVPAGPAAPIEQAAEVDGLDINVIWDSPVANDTAEGIIAYRVYRKLGVASEFALIATVSSDGSSTYNYADLGLASATEYNYQITSVAAGPTESAPSGVLTATTSDSLPIVITEITTDKWTHHMNGDNGVVSNLTVVTDVPATDVEWSAPVGTIEDNGETAVWTPGSGMPVGTVTIDVTVFNGSESDSSSIDLVITDLTILTSWMGRDMNGPFNIGTAGHFNDFGLSGMKYIGPDSSGAIQDLSGGNLSDYLDGQVVVLGFWEHWCGPCKAEMPTLNQHAAHFAPHGVKYFFLANDGGGDDENAVKSWFDANNIHNLHHLHYYPNPYYGQMGGDGYIPCNQILDRDGYCRYIGGAAIDWDDMVAELSGAPPFV